MAKLRSSKYRPEPLLRQRCVEDRNISIVVFEGFGPEGREVAFERIFDCECVVFRSLGWRKEEQKEEGERGRKGGGREERSEGRVKASPRLVVCERREDHSRSATSQGDSQELGFSARDA